jgi:magnesium transporter
MIGIAPRPVEEKLAHGPTGSGGGTPSRAERGRLAALSVRGPRQVADGTPGADGGTRIDPEARGYDRRVIVDCAAYEHGKRVTGRLLVSEIAEWLDKPDTFVWLGLRIPTVEELAEGFQQCGVEDLEVDEVLSPHERPVFALDGEQTTLVLRTAHYNTALAEVKLGELSVIVGSNYVISVRHGQASPLSTTRKELEREPEVLAMGPAAVLAAIVTTVVEDYRPVLDAFERATVEVEKDVFAEGQRRPVKRLYQLKRQVRELSVAIEALDEPLDRLIRRRRVYWPSDVIGDLEEAADLLDRGVSRASSLSDLLNSALDASLAQISVQQNEDMRKISAWVAIAAVPTMIAGIYGMNFENLPELSWDLGYPGVLLLMAAICGFMYRRFRKSGWL